MQSRLTILALSFLAGVALSFIEQRAAKGAERFYISIPGPTLSYVPLYYGQETSCQAARQVPSHGRLR